MKSIQMELPKDVADIIHTLEKAGYEAYAVGGCVRDRILGREPQDWDITTSAKPEQIKRLFPKTIDTGIQHGTVTVLRNRMGYEVTTYRIDGEYEDNRHPSSVEFTDNLALDLERRDFTMNAMAYNDGRGLVDEFQGLEDLEAGVIRCVGNPGDRFDEDALRMLRAVRFSGQLCFSMEENTRQAAEERVAHLKQISAERIRVELTKLLVARDAGRIRDAYRMGMTKVFLPELDDMMDWEQRNPHHIYTVGEHSIRSVEIMNFFFGDYGGTWDAGAIPAHVRENAEELAAGLTEKQHMMLCVAMLFHDLGKLETMTIDEEGIGHFYGHQEASRKKASKILRRLTFDNETIDTVKRLIQFHDYQFGEREKSMRKAVAKIGRDLMPMLFLVRYCDILAQNPKMAGEKIDCLNRGILLWRQVEASGAALTLKELDISGRDVMALGVAPGPEVGAYLHRVLEWVLEHPDGNRREKLLDYLRHEIEKRRKV